MLEVYGTHVTFATLVRVLKAYLYTEPADRYGVSMHPTVLAEDQDRASPTCIEYKGHALAGVKENDRPRIAAVVSLELNSCAVVRVVGKVEEDLIVSCCRHAGLGGGADWARSSSD